MNNKNFVFLLLVAFAILLIGSIISSSGSETAAPAETVACIDSGAPLRQHIHSQLKIYVDDKEEIIPPGIGLNATCHRVVHTHEADGEIHVEANDRQTYTLGMFYELWGESFERPGKILSVFVDELPFNGNPGDITLSDRKGIVLRYTNSSL